MSFEEFRRMLLRRRESERLRDVPQLGSFDSAAADVEEDVGAIRLSSLQAALKERRGPESEG
jgi:hypothetical protein